MYNSRIHYTTDVTTPATIYTLSSAAFHSNVSIRIPDILLVDYIYKYYMTAIVGEFSTTTMHFGCLVYRLLYEYCVGIHTMVHLIALVTRTVSLLEWSCSTTTMVYHDEYVRFIMQNKQSTNMW